MKKDISNTEYPHTETINLFRELNDVLVCQRREIADTSVFLLRETIDLTKIAQEQHDTHLASATLDAQLKELEKKIDTMFEGLSSALERVTTLPDNLTDNDTQIPEVQKAIADTVASMQQTNTIGQAALTMGISTMYALVTKVAANNTQEFLSHKEMTDRLTVT